MTKITLLLWKNFSQNFTLVEGIWSIPCLIPIFLELFQELLQVFYFHWFPSGLTLTLLERLLFFGNISRNFFKFFAFPDSGPNFVWSLIVMYSLPCRKGIMKWFCSYICLSNILAPRVKSEIFSFLVKLTKFPLISEFSRFLQLFCSTRSVIAPFVHIWIKIGTRGHKKFRKAKR